MQIINEVKLDFDDVLIKPKRSTVGSRADVDLVRNFITLHSKYNIEGVGIVASNMDATGTLKMAEEFSHHKMFTCLHKFYPENDLIDFFNGNEASKYTFYTLGITEKDFEKLKVVNKYTKLDKICIDVANGYTKFFVDKVREVREMFPLAAIMAGNVATPDMVQELLISGHADIIKIGIGPGAHCATRQVTGVGYPQLSAIIECADAAHGIGGLVCADGGCKSVGDICKALGAGADFVMLGTMLAGHEECDGEWLTEGIYRGCDENGKEIIDKRKYCMKFYGMSSEQAMDKYYGGVAEHRAPEGICSFVEYKGNVEDTIRNILGGIRSACTYVGTDKLKHFSKCTTFVRI